MYLSDVKKILNADILCCEDNLKVSVNSACSSDLMSDVLAHIKEQKLLLTGLINPQVIRTAEMMDIMAVVFVRGKIPTPDVVEMAKSRSIILMTTKFSMYVSSGLLYSNGLINEGVHNELTL